VVRIDKFGKIMHGKRMCKECCQERAIRLAYLRPYFCRLPYFYTNNGIP